MNMEWLYENNEDNSARFVLGQVFNPTGKTLLCFGINPSTACPEKLDNTIRKIIRICNYNGYENWIMLNIYPQRATNPNDMHLEPDEALIKANLLHIRKIAEIYPICDVLLAYGNLISKRKYLRACLNEILTLLIEEQGKKIKIIKLTKANNPVHPLYQSKNSILRDYVLSSI
jgi:serine/threonine protein phosphatase 1